MSITLSSASLPVFQRALTNLKHLLAKAQSGESLGLGQQIIIKCQGRAHRFLLVVSTGWCKHQS